MKNLKEKSPICLKTQKQEKNMATLFRTTSTDFVNRMIYKSEPRKKRLFVFLCGGAGCRFLQSLTQLLATGMFSDIIDEIVPVILEYDDKSVDFCRAMSSLKAYKQISDEMTERNVDSMFFNTQIITAEDFYEDSDMGFVPSSSSSDDSYMLFNNNEDTQTITEKYNLNEIFENHPDLRLLTESLFGDKSSILNIPIDNISTPTVLRMQIGNLCNNPIFKRISSHLRYDDRILVVGSLTGNTGITFTNELMKALNKTREINKNIIMGFIANHPVRLKNHNKDCTFRQSEYKASKYMEFLCKKNSYDIFNAIYYIGEDKYVHKKGGMSQGKYNIYYYILAVLALKEFCQYVPKLDKAEHFEYNFAMLWSNESPSTNIIRQFYNSEFGRILLKPLLRFSLAMKYLHDIILPMEQNNMREPMEKFVTEYYTWVKDMEYVDGEEVEPLIKLNGADFHEILPHKNFTKHMLLGGNIPLFTVNDFKKSMNTVKKISNETDISYLVRRLYAGTKSIIQLTDL